MMVWLWIQRFTTTTRTNNITSCCCSCCSNYYYTRNIILANTISSSTIGRQHHHQQLLQQQQRRAFRSSSSTVLSTNHIRRGGPTDCYYRYHHHHHHYNYRPTAIVSRMVSSFKVRRAKRRKYARIAAMKAPIEELPKVLYNDNIVYITTIQQLNEFIYTTVLSNRKFQKLISSSATESIYMGISIVLDKQEEVVKEEEHDDEDDDEVNERTNRSNNNDHTNLTNHHEQQQQQQQVNNRNRSKIALLQISLPQMPIAIINMIEMYNNNNRNSHNTDNDDADKNNNNNNNDDDYSANDDSDEDDSDEESEDIENDSDNEYSEYSSSTVNDDYSINEDNDNEYIITDTVLPKSLVTLLQINNLILCSINVNEICDLLYTQYSNITSIPFQRLNVLDLAVKAISYQTTTTTTPIIQSSSLSSMESSNITYTNRNNRDNNNNSNNETEHNNSSNNNRFTTTNHYLYELLQNHQQRLLSLKSSSSSSFNNNSIDNDNNDDIAPTKKNYDDTDESTLISNALHDLCYYFLSVTNRMKTLDLERPPVHSQNSETVQLQQQQQQQQHIIITTNPKVLRYYAAHVYHLRLLVNVLFDMVDDGEEQYFHENIETVLHVLNPQIPFHPTIDTLPDQLSIQRKVAILMTNDEYDDCIIEKSTKLSTTNNSDTDNNDTDRSISRHSKPSWPSLSTLRKKHRIKIKESKDEFKMIKPYSRLILAIGMIEFLAEPHGIMKRFDGTSYLVGRCNDPTTPYYINYENEAIVRITRVKQPNYPITLLNCNDEEYWINYPFCSKDKFQFQKWPTIPTIGWIYRHAIRPIIIVDQSRLVLFNKEEIVNPNDKPWLGPKKKEDLLPPIPVDISKYL